jgi:hypothetical protein
MSLTQDDLKKLRSPFPADKLGVKIQSFSKDKTKAMLVLYVQHTDAMDRLEEVDPAWSAEVLQEQSVGDTVYVRMRLTVKGVSRENVGEGGDPKGAYSDALKRCAMLFGVGRYLYDSETVWTPYDDQRDRFRSWSYDDYKACLRGHQKGVPLAQAEEEKEPRVPGWSAEQKKVAAPRAKPENQVKKKREAPTEGETERQRMNTRLMRLHRDFMRTLDEPFANLLLRRYSVGETRLMTLEQCEDLAQYMESQINAEVR